MDSRKYRAVRVTGHDMACCIHSEFLTLPKKSGEVRIHFTYLWKRFERAHYLFFRIVKAECFDEH